MKDILPVIDAFLKLITPDPAKKHIRLEKAELRLELKKVRIASRMYKRIRKEFKKDGFTDEENQILSELKQRIREREMELI